jgi:peptide/nickel transport system substrate-binding protein
MSDGVLDPMTRRSLMGAAAATGLVLAGCGGSSGTTASNQATQASGSAPTADRKKGGTFLLGDSAMAAAASADIQTFASSWPIAAAMTDGLVYRTHDFKIDNALAEMVEPVGDNPQVWNIRLKDGLEFQNGKTIGADDVIYTLRRNLNPKSPGPTSGLMTSIDVNQMKKLDARTVRLRLHYPNSQLIQGLAEIPSGILPVGFDPMKPIGSGPFKQVSLTPNRRWVGVKHPNYWRPGQPYLDRLELVAFADQSARANALISGQVDGVDRVLPSQVAQLKGQSGINVVTSEAGAFHMAEMNSKKGSDFEDPRVRLAFKFMMNRPQLMNVVYNGLSALGNDTGTWPQWDPAYPTDIPQRPQDLEQARSLLKQAGKEGMATSLMYAEIEPGMTNEGDVLIEQSKAIGVTLHPNLITDISQYFGNKAYYTTPLKITASWTQTVFMNLAYLLAPGAPYNSTFWNPPKLQPMMQDALASTGDAYIQKMGDVARMIHDDGPWANWSRHDLVDAISNKFTGMVPDATNAAFNGLRFYEISLA